MFNTLIDTPADELHELSLRFLKDRRENKIDLGIGVYRNEQGKSEVMQAIRIAEKKLWEQEQSKSYLPLRGSQEFIDRMNNLLLGELHENRITSIQTVGGTGGVRLALELSQKANPNLTVHVGVPTWPNHLAICNSLKIPVSTFEYYHVESQKLEVDRLFSALKLANRGDLFILHGPCHNPSGEDLSREQLGRITEIAERNGIVLLIDSAYYGMANELRNDLETLSGMLKELSTGFLVMSCSKAFSLYRERTGILFAACPNSRDSHSVLNELQRSARTSYSMSPAHGAQTVATVLNDPELFEMWQKELRGMRSRIVQLRKSLATHAAGDPRFDSIENQKGIFSMLALSCHQIKRLEVEHSIYIPRSGRINIAGLTSDSVSRFYQAIHAISSL